MVKYLLSLLLLLQCPFLQAQSHNGDDLLVIPRIFANYTWNSGPENTRSTAGVFATEWMIGSSVGSSGFGLELGFRKYLSETVALETGLSWMQTGYLNEFDAVRTERDDTLYVNSGRFDFANNYLRVPITIVGELNGSAGFYFQGGAYVALLTGQGGDYIVNRTSFFDPVTGDPYPEPLNETFPISTPAESLDAGAMLGIGINSVTKTGNYLNLALRGWTGLQNVWEDAERRQAGLELVFGYGFAIQKSE